MKLGSEGVYLHEKCGTNPSRHLPGSKTIVKNKKRPIWGSRGFRANILYINSRSTALSGLYVSVVVEVGTPGDAGHPWFAFLWVLTSSGSRRRDTLI